MSTPIQVAFFCHCSDCGSIGTDCRMAGVSVPAHALEISGELSSDRYEGVNAPTKLRFRETCSTLFVVIPDEQELRRLFKMVPYW